MTVDEIVMEISNTVVKIDGKLTYDNAVEILGEVFRDASQAFEQHENRKPIDFLLDIHNHAYPCPNEPSSQK